mmetsp:Transcript_89875/g.279710  ORF Transcript_89875/g.279710 Transcript_89875/m.279710 type:complete len:233 (-) Transcript_89875:512-1210(-)
MSTGILLNLPWRMSSRGSSGTVFPSTTACQPSCPRTSSLSFAAAAKENSPKMLRAHLGVPRPRESSSATQSVCQSSSAFFFLSKQRSVLHAFLRSQPALLIMNLVRSRLAVRDQKSATGEWKAARWKRPCEPGATMCTRMMPLPSLWPCNVTRWLSPPKAWMLLCTQRRAACWSSRPRFSEMFEPGREIQPRMPRRKSKLMKMVGYFSDCVMPSPRRSSSKPPPCWLMPPWK